ncbi:hypothetical protein J3F83DRAFT_25751 [Trichoderma novae-zelandiae]
MNARLSFILHAHQPFRPILFFSFAILHTAGNTAQSNTHYCSPSRNHEIVPGNYHNRPGPPLSISDRNLMKSTPQPSIRTENAFCSTQRRHRCRALRDKSNRCLATREVAPIRDPVVCVVERRKERRNAKRSRKPDDEKNENQAETPQNAITLRSFFFFFPFFFLSFRFFLLFFSPSITEKNEQC